MRIAQLSDVHLRHHLPDTSVLPERQSRRMPELLERAMSLVRAEAPDLLVVSGDLVDYPLNELDDPERRLQGERDLRLMAQILDGSGCPRLVIPGNHDHPDSALSLFAPICDQTLAGHRVLSFPEDGEDELHVPHRRGSALARFERALSDAASAPQIHVQHYVVWPELNEGYPHTYAGAEALMEAITQSGLVRLVLSGHYHRGVAPFRIGETTFAVVPAFCVAPHPIWVYDLGDDDMQWHAMHVEG